MGPETNARKDACWCCGYLEYLEKYGGDKMRVKLFPDFAPYSFGFVIEQKAGDGWQHLFTGGLIFHGPHDALGSGSGPTFSGSGSQPEQRFLLRRQHDRVIRA